MTQVQIEGSHDEEGGSNGDNDFGVGTASISQSRTQPQNKTPSMYRVLLLNDDFTPMDFVILILQKFFAKNRTDATQVMLQVHEQGAGVAGIFTYEIAETKVYQVNQFAKQQLHPLKCTMEKV